MSQVWSLASHEFRDTDNSLDTNSFNNSVMLPSTTSNYPTNDPNKQQPFTCDLCGNKYTNRGSLTRHKLQCGNKEPKFICHFCAKKFYRRDKLCRHLNRQLKCCFCGTTFCRRDQLQKHLLMCRTNLVLGRSTRRSTRKKLDAKSG